MCSLPILSCIPLSLSFPPPDLPSPKLASLSDLKDICSKFYRSTVPTELGYTYDQIKSMDDIVISLLPEKKGTVFKHNEYMVESKVRPRDMLVPM